MNIMELTQEEQAMFDGDKGRAVQEAIRFQVEVGKFFNAKRFVPIVNAHVMGDIEVMGDGGLEMMRQIADEGAKCVVPSTSNARCMHFSDEPRLQPDKAEEDKERELVMHLRRMDISTTDTCINYQTVYQPKLGEHVAWGDTGTVIYANSVFGARSNFEAGKSSFAAALTGRTPAYGFHLDEVRRGNIVVNVSATLSDLADWGALGKIVGHPNQDYYAVPVFQGIDTTPPPDALKHLGASLASYGSMAMFHMVGVTPEAATLEAALGGNAPRHTMTVTDEDLQGIYDGYSFVDARKNIVVFSGPQQSLFEMQRLAHLFEGRKVAGNMTVVVTTNHSVYSDAKRLGYVDTLEQAGVVLLQGVCFYILQRLSDIRVENEWANLVSNSAKIVNTITAHRFNTVLRRTADCVDVACTGELK